MPNLNQSWLKGDNNFELIRPSIKNIIAKKRDQSLMLLLLSIGYRLINKKKIKKTIPKDLFELILIFLSDIFNKVILFLLECIKLNKLVNKIY